MSLSLTLPLSPPPPHLLPIVVFTFDHSTSQLCLCWLRDGAVKKKCADLTQGLADMMAEVLEIAHTPVDDATLPQAQLFGRLDAGLARSRWTEKVGKYHCRGFHLSAKLWISTRNNEDCISARANKNQSEKKPKSEKRRMLQTRRLD